MEEFSLIYSYQNNETEIVEKLLRSGFDLNEQNEDTGETILMMAIERDDLSMVKKLISNQDCDLNIRTWSQGKKTKTKLFLLINI